MARRPHPPVMTAAVITRKGQGTEEVLIGKIPADPYKGLWTFPAGPVEEGEMPEVALRRALRSLLNMRVEIICGQPPFDQPWDDVTCRWRFYFCNGAGSTVDNQHFAEVRWVPRGDLREYDFDPVSLQVARWMLEESG